MATKKRKPLIDDAASDEEELQIIEDELKAKHGNNYRIMDSMRATGLDFAVWRSRAIRKLQFWTKKRGYQFNFQFWGEGNNNVFIDKDYVEIASFGGERSILKIMSRTVEWCERANPRIKYPENINEP